MLYCLKRETKAHSHKHYLHISATYKKTRNGTLRLIPRPYIVTIQYNPKTDRWKKLGKGSPQASSRRNPHSHSLTLKIHDIRLALVLPFSLSPVLERINSLVILKLVCQVILVLSIYTVAFLHSTPSMFLLFILSSSRHVLGFTSDFSHHRPQSSFLP